jgi:hypothetical protein
VKIKRARCWARQAAVPPELWAKDEMELPFTVSEKVPSEVESFSWLAGWALCRFGKLRSIERV